MTLNHSLFRPTASQNGDDPHSTKTIVATQNGRKHVQNELSQSVKSRSTKPTEEQFIKRSILFQFTTEDTAAAVLHFYLQLLTSLKPLRDYSTVEVDFGCSSSTKLITAHATSTLPHPAALTTWQHSPVMAPQQVTSTALHSLTSMVPHQSARAALHRTRRTPPKLSTSAYRNSVARSAPLH
jgi:hypothetical protein